jgi:hypothetical protein
MHVLLKILQREREREREREKERSEDITQQRYIPLN